LRMLAYCFMPARSQAGLGMMEMRLRFDIVMSRGKQDKSFKLVLKRIDMKSGTLLWVGLRQCRNQSVTIVLGCLEEQKAGGEGMITDVLISPPPASLIARSKLFSTYID
jgi:hypothetical protein